MGQLKFRAWHHGEMLTQPINTPYGVSRLFGFLDANGEHSFDKVMMFTGLLDKHGTEIYFQDILRFSDKWEWYRTEYGGKLLFADEEGRKQLLIDIENEPYETRVVDGIEDYEWLLSSEIQSYWEVIGNIHENPELLK